MRIWGRVVNVIVLLVIYFVLVIITLWNDESTDGRFDLGAVIRAIAILPILLFIYCLLFEFK